MRQVIKELGSFIKSDFNIWAYSFFFILLFVVTRLNYHYCFYWNYINIQASGTERFIRFFLLFSVPWFIVAIPKLLISKKSEVLKDLKFYLAILLVLILIAFDSACGIFKPLLKFADTYDEQIYLNKIFINLQGTVIFLFSALIFIWINKKIRLSDIGLRLKDVNLKPYFILIIAILPMIIWASFNADFIATYPQFKPWNYPILFKIPKVITAIFYEFVYGVDFIALEFAFRGLLVIVIARFIGKDAVLPMAAVYCFLHFGKPEVEAFSSIFGGYLLGVLALSTRSIAPGVILHLSLAYMMDFAAYIQHYLK